MAAIHAAGRRMAAFLSSFDVILSTVLAGPPPKLGYLDQNGDPAIFAERVNATSPSRPCTTPPARRR